MKNILLQPAYVLHRRPYRETSFLVELFTPEHGRFTVIARGVRKAKSSTQGLLQPFTPLLVSCSGKGELLMLSHVEANESVKSLHGECLFAGFYLNELMMGLTEKWDAHPRLYSVYEKSISDLQADKLEQKTLRIFEKYLLEELGYGLLPTSDATLQQTFLADKYYRFVVEHGFVLSEFGGEAHAKSNIFLGKNLIAIAKENLESDEVLQDAKRLTRLVLTPLLGARQIHSRKLFVKE